MSSSPVLPSLPSGPGTYRWYYADVTSGEYSAVFIFMVGSLFSPRYSVTARQGGQPWEHAAVNFALYRKGVRLCWVLSEYPHLALESAWRLRIGGSTLSYEGNRVRMEVEERTAPWGRPVRANLTLEPLTPLGTEVQLVPDLPHWWQPMAPRARARLEWVTEGQVLEGLGYHDTNHGAEQLGARLPGWRWARTHGGQETVVDYVLPGGVAPVRVKAGEQGVQCEREAHGLAVPSMGRTGWGLRVPRHLHAGPLMVGEAKLLESSPFYARVEARRNGLDTLGEVADFRRFHLPYIRWMAHFRTRVERSS
ncbi:carotenoid 1,2-hydratase [Stigmatella aurantiaca]|uniref:Hydroxyneurosporene synthase (CrtC) n=1 Tax=Stigmatella aurantiaca (strain DW4/3-1) TaxID=378806 RepID=Q09AT6_STIAD|nr:carotenoid 1,2-hydratase [Stigmatella aurantiaca]ADO74833.1 Neurosporene hydroxylase [Stigmatella aurantiaca DW4/3-1]EAU68817.1 hydroxyneurosporene synthase (CrtC) [Stigmatella aurantiaca DW4/3-1]